MTELIVQDLVKRYGGLLATDCLNLTLELGEIHALIGPNGAGKTTLIKQLAGEVLPTSGSIRFRDRDITGLSVDKRALAGLGRTYQITSLFEEQTVLHNVMISVISERKRGRNFFHNCMNDRELVNDADIILGQVNLSAYANRPVSSLAYGVKRQLEIAVTLAMKPRVLLLDEPMAGMSRQESQEIVELIRGLRGRYAILLVEHDMDAVFALADRITVLVYGRAIATGTVAEIRANAEVRNAYLGGDDE